MLNIEISDEFEDRLDALAKEAGRSKEDYAKKAFEEMIEDLEDNQTVDKVLNNLDSGKDEIISSEEMWREVED